MVIMIENTWKYQVCAFALVCTSCCATRLLPWGGLQVSQLGLWSRRGCQVQGLFRAELAHCPSAVRFVQRRLLPTLGGAWKLRVLSCFVHLGPTWSHYLQLPLSHHPLGCRNGWGNHEDLSCKPYTCKIGSNESCAMCREQLAPRISIFPYFLSFSGFVLWAASLSVNLQVHVSWGLLCGTTPVAEVAKARGSEQPQPMRGLQPWLWTDRWSHVPPLRL